MKQSKKLAALAVSVSLLCTGPGGLVSSALAAGAHRAAPAKAARVTLGGANASALAAGAGKAFQPTSTELHNLFHLMGSEALRAGSPEAPRAPKIPAGPMAKATAMTARMEENPALRAIRKDDPAAQDAKAGAIGQIYKEGGLGLEASVEIGGGVPASAAANLAAPSAAPRAGRASRVSRLADQADEKSGSDIVSAGLILAGIAFIASIATQWGRSMWARVLRIGRGKAEQGMQKVEEANLDAIAEDYIQKLEAKGPALNQAVHDIAEQTVRLRLDLKAKKAEQEQLQKRVDYLLLNDKEAEADEIEAKKEPGDRLVKSMEEQLKRSETRLAEAKKALLQFFNDKEAEISRIRGQVSEAKLADLDRKLNSMRVSYSIDDLKGEANRIDEIVARKKAAAEADREVIDANPAEKVKDLDAEIAAAERKARLEARKKELQQKKEGGQS